MKLQFKRQHYGKESEVKHSQLTAFHHRRQPQYFLPLHSIRTMGNLTGKITFS